MSLIQNISIEKGRTQTITVDVTGVSDWTGLLAKLIASPTYGGTPTFTLTGRITGDQASFSTTAADTASLTDNLQLKYEVVIYNTGKTFLQNSTRGICTITPVVKVDPTI